MKLKRLRLSKFTAFEEASFEFASSVNVLIGENATGKSHVLKLLYVLNEAVRRMGPPEESGNRLEQFTSLEQALETLAMQTFMPDDLGRLVRRSVGNRTATIDVEWNCGRKITVKISNFGKLTVEHNGSEESLPRSVFVPPREVLSIFPGFISDWQTRVSNYDRTYYDLCLALDARPLRGARDARRSQLLAPLETALGGTVTLDNGRFYVRLPDGMMEAPLVAEGLRKLAMLAHLVVNGSLSDNAFLFWDEPEANMNPKLAQIVSEMILALGDWGVQVFLATHDYALGSELSLESERRKPDTNLATTAFLGLSRDETGSVHVEQSNRLLGLSQNPILDALASLHDRELQVNEG